MSEQSTWLVLLLTGLGGFGVTGFMWKIYELIQYYLWKNYVVSLNVNTKDPIYDCIVLWLKEHGPINESNHWAVQTNESSRYNFMPSVAESKEDKAKKMKFIWRPRPGTFLFRHYKTGQLMRLKINKQENTRDEFWNMDESGGEMKDWEVITLETFGKSPQVIKDLIAEAHSEHMKKVEGKTVVYRFSNDRRCWKSSGKSKNSRPWKSICTQNKIKESLLEDIKTFQGSADWYNTRGIPYRRGYLLYGPPGTGKSSLIYALAGELGSSLCVMTLSDTRLTDDDFIQRLETVPSNTIVLIEDVDVAIPSEKRQKDIETTKQRTANDEKRRKMEYSGQLTLSGILNGIDGVATPNGQIVIMTTNHKDNLDPALIRPGRIDMYFCLDNCNSKQIKDMCLNFYPDAENNDVEQMVKIFEGIKNPIAPAQFENFLLQFKKNIKSAINHIDVLEKSVDCDFKRQNSNKTIVYRYSDRKWKPCKPQNKRPWSTVITQNNIKEDILEDVTQFLEDEQFYGIHGVPYRRGYLLHGPPGTGKTSLVQSLVGKLDYGICSLNLSVPNMTDDDLIRCLSEVPNKCIVLIEEVDVAVPSKKRQKDIEAEKDKGLSPTKSNLTLSGVLNAIDGVASEDSQILIMTTNHKDHLDPALIRPGRVDRDFFLDNCNQPQVKDMFMNFFPSATEEDLNIVSEKFSAIESTVSPAKLQGYMLRYKRSISEVLENIHSLEDTSNQLPSTPNSGDSGCSMLEEKLSELVNETQLSNSND